MRWACTWFGVLGFVMSGCGKAQPPTVAPTDAEVASVPAEPAVGEDPANDPQDAEDDDGETSAEASEEAENADASDDGHLTVAAAAELVTAAIDEAIDPYAERVLTPPVPLQWPLEGKVAYYVYPLASFQGAAVDTYQAKTPSHRAILEVATRQVTLEEIPKPKSLGQYQHTRVRHDPEVAKAEQALLDLAAGRVEQSKVHYLLVAYGKWFEKHGKVGADCRTRAKAFADWAASWGK